MLKAGDHGRRPGGRRRDHAHGAGRRAPGSPGQVPGERRRGRRRLEPDVVRLPRRSATTTWTPLGTSETTSPARVPRRSAGLPDGALVEYRAVTVDAAGHRSAASTYAASAARRRRGRPTRARRDLLVTVPGSHNSEMGCPGDWQPDCADGPADQARRRHLLRHVHAAGRAATSTRSRSAAAGTRTTARAASRGGGNVAYTVAGRRPGDVLLRPVDALVHVDGAGPDPHGPGLRQQRAGLRRRLEAGLPEVAGCRTRTATARTRSPRTTCPTGAYEVKVAHNLGWDENYGAGGAPGGANIPFTAPGGKPVTFSYVLATHVLTIEVTDPPLPGTGEEQRALDRRAARSRGRPRWCPTAPTRPR